MNSIDLTLCYCNPKSGCAVEHSKLQNLYRTDSEAIEQLYVHVAESIDTVEGKKPALLIKSNQQGIHPITIRAR